MNTFNLRDFKAGKKAVTRNGLWEAGNYWVNESNDFPIIICLENIETGEDRFLSYTKSGGYYSTEDEMESEYDLFHQEKEMWVNVYESHTSKAYNSFKHADRNKDVDAGNFIGTYKLVK
jgi:hypothetical protein